MEKKKEMELINRGLSIEDLDHIRDEEEKNNMGCFFSLISDGEGKPYYFDAKIRKQIIRGEIKYALDSHISIADYFGFRRRGEKRINKFEYNPLWKTFLIDQLNTTNDSEQIKKFCERLDFKTIVPELIIKPITYPFRKNRKRIMKKDIQLLNKWASIRDSTWNPIWYLIENSVGKSVWESVETTIQILLWDSVGDLFSSEDPAGDLVWNLIKDSIGAYTVSFFKFPRRKNPCQSCADLWERGLLTSCDDGEIWRLHGGKRGEVLWKD